jgi:hypothetical protein
MVGGWWKRRKADGAGTFCGRQQMKEEGKEWTAASSQQREMEPLSQAAASISGEGGMGSTQKP